MKTIIIVVLLAFIVPSVSARIMAEGKSGIVIIRNGAFLAFTVEAAGQNLICIASADEFSRTKSAPCHYAVTEYIPEALR